MTGDWQKFKGEPAPAPMKVAEPKPDKKALYEAAVRAAGGEEPAEGATTPRKKAAPKKAADTGHDLPQRLRGATPATDDLAQVVRVHAHLEGLAPPAVEQVDGDVLGVVDDALDQVLERFFEHVLLGGRLGRGARRRALAAGTGGLGDGLGGLRGGLLPRGGRTGGGPRSAGRGPADR